MKKLCFWLLFCLISVFSSAQSDYKTGYIVMNQDTISGFIEFRNWKFNPGSIRFKKMKFIEYITYSSDDIEEFAVNRKKYVSRSINESNGGIVGGSVFLEVIYQGTKSLYSYRVESGEDRFYIVKDNKVEWLRNPKRSGMNNKAYIKQLSEYLGNCSTMSTKIANSEYTLKSIASLFDEYYKCTNENLLFKNIIEEGRFTFGVVSGVSITKLKVHSAVSEFLDKTNYKPSFDYTGGLYVDYIFLRSKGQWSSYNELLYGSYKAKGVLEIIESEEKYKIIKSELGNRLLKLNNMIRYTRPIGKVNLLLSTGISNEFALSEWNHADKKEVYYTLVRESSFKAIEHTKDYFFSFLFGAGVQYNHFSFEGRIAVGNGLSEYFNSTKTRYTFLASYRF